MSSVIFNSFKKRYLKGEVPREDTWTFIPVSTNFKPAYEKNGVKLEQYRGISDFKEVNHMVFTYNCDTQGPDLKGKVRKVNVTDNTFRLKGSGLIEGYKVNYRWFATNDRSKPIFINDSNKTEFENQYQKDISNNNNINSYYTSGFYYIQTVGELLWFADRTKENNNIIGVFGNDISCQISKPIGIDENKPFEGILDGNYHRFYLKIKGKNSDNGLVGILGKNGIVRNFRLKGVNDNTIECANQISLNYIKKDGRDINCGILVGRNYGRVENIDAGGLGKFNLNGFVPSVYSVTNKSDNYRWNETTKIVREKYGNNDNYFYLNSFCINSPANICPYVGYFNEGKFSEGMEAVCSETYRGFGSAYDAWDYDFYTTMSRYAANWAENGSNTKSYDYNIKFSSLLGIGDCIYYPIMGNAYAYRYNITDYVQCIPLNPNTPDAYTILGYEKTKFLLSHNPLYYGVDNEGKFTVRVVGHDGDLTGDSSDDWKFHFGTYTVNYNNNLIDKAFGSHYQYTSGLEPSYENTRCSIRLHPQARAAYNVGVIIGTNHGTAENIQVSTTVKNTSNFVGFIGGLIGKQAEGYINNVSVYMDNEFVYDSKDPSKGDVAYYKQTPILPNCLKELIPNNNPNRDKVIKDFFTPWDYSEQGYAVNTAENVTDDVIAYRLRPIFVVGGLFGRFVPSYRVTNVNNATVLYKDNYKTSNTQKRLENSFGVLAGKVDYSLTTNGIDIKSTMNCNNCKFSALTTVGDTYNVIGHYYDNGWRPASSYISGDGDSAVYSLNTGTSTSRFVGVYEIKNNIFDPMSIDVNSASTSYDASYSSRKAVDFGIYYAGDYPMDMSSHNGGIIKTHNFWPFIAMAMERHESVKNACSWIDVSNTPYSSDINHKYYECPNVDRNNLYDIAGYNKRNMASNIISMNRCYSNVQNYINVYDDYINEWNIMKLPPGYESKTSFSADELENIHLYWSHYKSNKNIILSGSSTTIQTLKTDLHISDDSAFSGISAWFTDGLLTEQCYHHVRNGTQNAFDGYTTVDFKRIGLYDTEIRQDIDYKDSMCYLSGVQGGSSPSFTMTIDDAPAFIDTTTSWSNPRTLRKNMMHHYNGNWNTTYTDISYETRCNFPSRTSKSVTNSFNYQQYLSNHYITGHFGTIDDVFGYTLPISFEAQSNAGYSTPKTQIEKKYNLTPKISIGQVNNPTVIFNEIMKTTDKTYTTTAVSSKNKFGGLLVVDSSGNNVMFLDNESSLELTGNVITYPVKYEDNNKYILTVE